MKTLLTLGIVLLVALPVAAQQRREPDPRSMGGGDCRDNVYNCADTPNPLPTTNTVWLEEMTWMDVRDALAAGTTTAIIPTGGMEPNGPWLVTGKHNYVLRATCDAIARRLGHAICTPIIKLVPEGAIEPPIGHMRSPGTLSLRQETFEALLTDVAHSLKMHGFRNIIFIGDSGGNQRGQRAVAEKLNAAWKGGPVVAHVQEYYDYASVARYMAYRGLESGEGDGLHDDPIITLNIFYTDPSSVRYDERVTADLATIDGVSLADRVQSLERAREIVRFRARHTVEAINQAIANRGTLPAPPNISPPRTGGGRGQQQRRPAPDPLTMGGGDCRANAYNCSDTPNPLPAVDTVWLEDMTWMDVRDALAAGKTTAIIPTGGIEPNGPWLVTGKHNYVLRANCDAIARDLGNAICAPVLELVPEGRIEPPSGHMRSPGTLSLRQETFEAVLTDVAHSLKMPRVHPHHLHRRQRRQSNRYGERGHGAHGPVGRPAGRSPHPRVLPGPADVLRDLGVTRAGMPDDGLHDNAAITLNMMLDEPRSVRWADRVATRQAVINGVSIADLGRSLELAKRTADVIRSRIVAGEL